MVVIRGREHNLMFRILTPAERKGGISIHIALLVDNEGIYSLPKSTFASVGKSQPLKKGLVNFQEIQLKYEVFEETGIVIPTNYRFLYPPEIHGKVSSSDEEYVFDVLNILPELMQIKRSH